MTACSGEDENNNWIIKEPHGEREDSRKNQVVKNGDVIRLQHKETRRNLHSHFYCPSPVTAQQEVTAFEKHVGNEEDNWQVQLTEYTSEYKDLDFGFIRLKWRLFKRRPLYRGHKLKLIHVKTNCALHSHANYCHPEYTSGQQEVTCFGDRSCDDFWILVDEFSR